MSAPCANAIGNRYGGGARAPPHRGNVRIFPGDPISLLGLRGSNLALGAIAHFEAGNRLPHDRTPLDLQRALEQMGIPP
jgi:hypothetical protein